MKCKACKSPSETDAFAMSPCCKKVMCRPCVAVRRCCELKAALAKNEPAKLPLREVDIKPRKATVNEMSIELLEEMLEMAKRGEIQEVVAVCILEDGAIGSNYTPTMNFIQRIGAIEFIKQRWLATADVID